MSKLIPLTQGKFALVDNQDYEWLNQFKWFAWHNHSGVWYAIRMDWDLTEKKRCAIRMHREILHTPKNLETDHINGDGLDNRRQNLRTATRSLNQHNQHSQRPNKTSQYRGVSWSAQNKKWHAQIRCNNKKIHLGFFENEKEASEKYENQLKQFLNHIQRGER